MRIDTSNLCKLMQAVLSKAKVGYLRNCLRHNFCFYAFSMTGDHGKTRKWSRHRTEKSFDDNT